MAKTYATDWAGYVLDGVGGLGGDYYTWTETKRANRLLKGQVQGLAYAMGPRLITGMVVSAGSGLSVNITAGITANVSSTLGPAILMTTGTVAFTVPASSTSYIFSSINAGATPGTVQDSLETRAPLFAWSGTNTMDGGVLLATVVTGASTVTKVTPVVVHSLDKALAWEGVYDPDKTYAKQEYVMYPNSSGLRYISIADSNAGITPGTDPTKWVAWTEAAGVDIHGLTAKTAGVDADEITLWDSAATAIKKMTFANLRKYIFGVVTTKGDLLGGTAAGTVDRLGVGTNGQALVADSTQATGLKWGSLASSVVTQGKRPITASTTVLATDDFIFANATSGNITITLLSSATGRVVGIVKTDASANTVTVTRAGSDTVNGTTSKVISAQNESYFFSPDGGTAYFLF